MDTILFILAAVGCALAALLAIAAILMPIVVISINGKLGNVAKSLAAMERMMRAAESRSHIRK